MLSLPSVRRSPWRKNSSFFLVVHWKRKWLSAQSCMTCQLKFMQPFCNTQHTDTLAVPLGKHACRLSHYHWLSILSFLTAVLMLTDSDNPLQSLDWIISNQQVIWQEFSMVLQEMVLSRLLVLQSSWVRFAGCQHTVWFVYSLYLYSIWLQMAVVSGAKFSSVVVLCFQCVAM